ncbi:MAG: SurA N-terminal domain-containing protein, partial [Candidatus Wallbacteria bacterium]|nr:SurA N-terminal domain-containing protein [Candidatus Wallbacteria bacterium]
MLFGKGTQKRWISFIIWTIIACFVGSIFVFGASCSAQRTRERDQGAVSDNDKGQREPGDGVFPAGELDEKLLEVGGESIRLRDFYLEYENINPEYRGYMRLDTLGGKIEYLKNMGDRLVILQKAKEMKLEITDEQTVNAIIENYQKAGQAIDKGKLQESLKKGDQELMRWFEEQKIPLIVERVQDEVIKGVTVSQAEIESYYEEHSKEFTVKIMRDGREETVRQGLGEVEDRIRGILIQNRSEQAAYNFYEEHREMFREPGRIRVAHIFL